MSDKFFPFSKLPIRKSVELLPKVFQTEANDKFLAGVVDPLVQPGLLDKVTGYIGRRFGKTYNGSELYVDTDATLRSAYQLEPGVILKNHNEIEGFWDYIDFKNQLKFFGNTQERDDKITSQEHYTWNPPIDWDMFINYREYYWIPDGPPSIPIYGQSGTVSSTYRVILGTTKNSFVFTPDAYTNNPTLTLYRGQTYKFRINAPGEGFSIRTNYDTGSLIFKPGFGLYTVGSLAVYDNKLYRAKKEIIPGDLSSITIDSEDWEYLEPASSGAALEYNKGVTNNGIENGTLTFTVPFDAPDTLYYQGLITPDTFGRFVIADIESNTYINVDKDIAGKSTYVSSNGITFSNGMVVEFRGNVNPEKYATDTWLIEGVGTAITLTKFSDLIVPVLTATVPEVLFDNAGFDTEPFDDAAAYPTFKDYITIAKDSIDANPWSRYNRWFHRNVLEIAYTFRGQDFPAEENTRAKRPIIEFSSNLQLFDHGAVAKKTVDYLDDNTTDILSLIEGSAGYNVDGEFLFDGARILATADTDRLTNNKIYEVRFIRHINSRQIHLVETEDSDSVLGQGVLVRRGNKNGGRMFHYNGTSWVPSQTKTTVNQAPRFDVFDSAGVSFADSEKYITSSFIGSKILSYKQGSGRIDTELGFSLSYLNIDNVGDIEFNFDWDSDIAEYTETRIPKSVKISTGFYKFNPDTVYDNGWLLAGTEYTQPIIDSQVIINDTNTLTFNTINWNLLTVEPIINIYINGTKYNGTYTRTDNIFVFPFILSAKDAVVLKVIADLDPDQGYYEIPIGIEKNPFNAELQSFTLGQAVDHVISAVEFQPVVTGNIPGASNLRDISGYQKHAKRFVKHSGIAPLAIMTLCDKTHNIIKSIQYAKKSYTDFKNNFIIRALEIEYNDSVPNFVDDIIDRLAKNKTSVSSFADSDMLGAGAYTAITYKVEDVGIKIFALSEKFDLVSLSSRAVYVYLNSSQLLNTKDYEFNSTFGFVQLTVPIQQNDIVEIREYISTATNYIPLTPTSMGLYKKYTPMKFIDDTYQEPREVIQGHDGSITTAYGDFRDDLILELEYRIYNNIKQEYDPEIFDIDSILGGYYGNGLYTKSQLDDIVNQEFLKWIQNTNINYTLNTYFDSENSFTYTYSRMSDPTKTQTLPGYWRGVYKWFYDTDRPHRCPWEMLGFSQEPTWWQTQYGPSPYTRNNLILWEDLENGHIRQGTRAGRYDRYKRPGLLSHIPTDSDGKLLSPLDSGLAQDFSLINNRGSFILGDSGPVEYAWRSSSEWPFAVVMAMCLMKPFEFITDNFDRSRTSINILGQTVNNTTSLFSTLDKVAPGKLSDPHIGLIKYITAYVKSRGLSQDTTIEKIDKLNVGLSYRMSGFVDQQQQKFLLDSKSPAATTSSIYVPAENYDIIFNVSAPVATVAFSGVIFEKTEGGWIVTGYDDIHPYFKYHQALTSQRDPLISVGGISATFLEWTSNKNYNNGVLIRYSNDFYRALRTHNSGDVFDSTAWQKLSVIPKIGAVEALRRREFNTLAVKRVSYGTLFTSIQQVVDFLLGYESYLKELGFRFNRYDKENQVSQDWLSSVKEFMFWTKHNWELGSLLAVSPVAQKVDVIIPVGVADNILDGFYDYQVLKGDGKPLEQRFINVNRSFQNITVETTNTTDGIFFLKLNYVLKEHVTVFDDRTVFNDILYDKTTGYRQERIKSQGFRTVDWDGDYTSPGFIFDNVNIQAWQPFRDYKLGDIVSYKSFNWTSLINQLGTELFNDAYWTKVDSTPLKQLIPNFDYKIKQFSDYFETASEGTNQNQRALARHTIGYQKRDYLNNLAEDPVSQFQLYQGFIREKGSANAITKIFDKLSRSGTDSITLNEEWAFLVGRIGGTDQLTEIEIQIEKNKLQLNPQLFLIESTETTTVNDQNYRITASDFTISPVPYATNITATSFETDPTVTAGYVSNDQYDHEIPTQAALTTLDIATVDDNDHIWVTFNKDSWTVLRVNTSEMLIVAEVARFDDTTVTVTFNRPHVFETDTYVGFRNIINLQGFFKIVSVTNITINVQVDSDILDPEIDSSTVTNPIILTESRFNDYQMLDQAKAALLDNGSKLFIDNNGSNLWEVIQKQKQYSANAIIDYATTSPINAGKKVIYDTINKQMIVSMPGSGIVIVYAESAAGLILKQIISPPVGFFNNVLGSFGNKMAISPNGTLLVIGADEASGVTSTFRGLWSTLKFYAQDDVVLYGGRLYKAKNANTVIGDGSSELAINTDDWELATIIPATTSGSTSSLTQQGMVAVYTYANGRFSNTAAFVSPRPADNEKFGSEITVSVSGSSYYMAVSATGSYNNTGRVYLFKFDGTAWRHLENPMYKGVYDFQESYKAGEIVWQAAQDPLAEAVRGNLWMNLEDSTSDGSTITIESQGWLKVSDISTNCSLPTSLSVEDDGSTLEFATTGLLSQTQTAELVKQGDKFGSSMAMNSNGSILIIGAPDADGQYFPNYRGLWRGDVEYVEGEVVRFKDLTAPGDSYQYYRLGDAFLGADSTYRSYNEDPSNSVNWQVVGDSTTQSSGKVYVYARTAGDVYELKQMINAASISSFSDIDSGLIISTGDQFGFSMDTDFTGNTLVVSSPKADINYQDQGSVYVLELDTATTEYRVKQRLESFETYPNEYFGYGVSISPDAEKIAVGARNASTQLPITFDILRGTTFDNASTRFSINQGYTGGVYIFDKKDQTFFLTEKLQEIFSPGESFGFSIDCVGSYVAVGSPFYRPPNETASGSVVYQGDFIGNARLFKKDTAVSSWNTIRSQQPVVDIRKIRSIELYDNVRNVKIQDIDFIDSAKGKILNIAEQEIKFKTPYDPAVYTIGNDQVVTDAAIAWYEANVGKLWWNTNTAKWIYAEQGDTAFRTGNWNRLTLGSSIDVYEWIQSALLPNEWAAIADTNEGFVRGISGQPLYPNNDVYSVKQIINPATGLVQQTLYFYWVKNITIIPANMPGRSRSAAEVANIIANPVGTGVTFVSLIDSNKFILYNLNSVMSSDTALLNIKYRNDLASLRPIHSEYQLLTESVAGSVPTKQLENKWIDSLVGTDINGNRVPDTKLSAKQKYGINFRPRQSMFVDRIMALKLAVTNINSVLTKQPFADLINFTKLNATDLPPVPILNLYDIAVDTEIELQIVGTVRIKQAVLRANLVDGELDTVDIIDSGSGYKVIPPVVINGDGSGAKITLVLDNQGRVATATVTSRGKNYRTLLANVRNFSVLVTNDSTINNFWSIYAWDDVRKVFFRSRSQAYDTTKYWNNIDWYDTGYSANIQVTREILSVFQEPEYFISVGDLIRVKEYGTGGWAVFEKITNTASAFSDRFKLVARENGTIELKSSLYDTALAGIGFDNTQSFDNTTYDISNSIELRNILQAVKQDIFISDLAIEWNKLFFSSIRYALSEQPYVDWVFKTSFLNATHTVGDLTYPRINYKNDNLESYQQYIDEVKPFRTTVREYISLYKENEPYQADTTDFDLAPSYSVPDGRVVSITDGQAELQQYPWKWWTDNNGYSVVNILLHNYGTAYTTVPRVVIEGNGTGATAQAYISNGKVSGIKILTPGIGYTQRPTIVLVGGNSGDGIQAKATAVLGDTKIRTFDLTIKFDRISKTSDYQVYTQNQTFVATGNTSVFELNYAPTKDKTKITIFKNDQLVLNNEYTLSLYYASTDSYKLLRGKIIFNVAPNGPPPPGQSGAPADVITVIYETNIELLSAVNRIDRFYNPTAGMIGKELNQLMTGIDFGGVQIQGTTFEVTGGWDALPWFTDNWDSVETNSDYYVICDGSTSTVTLPYIPNVDQVLNIYIKRAGTNQTIRIDDPAYTNQVDSSTSINPNAEMPTFIGNGINNVIEIGSYIETVNGDILIFRPIESDGSVTITDDNLLDTQLSGGTLSAIDSVYVTAKGITAEEIVVVGGKFIEPDHVPAPEENVPGQIMDSVSIKVFQSTSTGSAVLQSKIIKGDGTLTDFNIDQEILENNSVIVYVNKIKKYFGLDYTLDLSASRVEFITAPINNSVIEIISIGIGGIGILSSDMFIADGTTNLFLTDANYVDTARVFVTLNGEPVDIGFINSTGVVDAPGKTLVQFGIVPPASAVIRIISLEANADVDSSGVSVVQVNKQTLYFEGSTRSFDLEGFVALTAGSAPNSIIVEVEGQILQGSDTIYVEYDGTNNAFILGQDPFEVPGTILPINISVYVNNQLKTYVTDYSYNGTSKELTIYPVILNVGDNIKIENNRRAQYFIVGSNLVIDSAVPMFSSNETDNVEINITWFSQYSILDIISDEISGGKVQYQLPRAPISASYVWVYKNGVRLTQDQDYYVNIPRNVVYIDMNSVLTDVIKIVLFSSDIYRLPSAYEIHKDMLNIYHYNRFSKNEVTLATALHYYDTTITVTDGSQLTAPIPSRNVPGIILIEGERIEYMSKAGNLLSQLRRGSQGTAIAEVYALGSSVIDVGANQTLPYNETQDRTDFVSDGSTLLIGPLNFVPAQGARTSWFRNTVPGSYGPCDQIEIFAGGRRLRKDPIDVWVESNGAYSPTADETREAEFAVDGTTAYIRLTEPLAAGTRVTVIKRIGKTWYDRGQTTASNGQTLLDNTNSIARFIAEKTTLLPR